MLSWSVVSWIRSVTRDRMSHMSEYAEWLSRAPTRYAITSFVSASMAVHVHASPASGLRSRMDGSFWTVFFFAPTNDQISSHCTRFASTLRTISSWNAPQTVPASAKSLLTVLIETSATRETDRMELPSQSSERICARFATGSL